MVPEDAACTGHFNPEAVFDPEAVPVQMMASAGPGLGAAACCGGHCCRGVVNIFVNNTVQGVTDSVLLGSKVVMRDPGLRMSFSEHGSRDNKGLGSITSRIIVRLMVLWFVSLGIVLLMVLSSWELARLGKN